MAATCRGPPNTSDSTAPRCAPSFAGMVWPTTGRNNAANGEDLTHDKLFKGKFLALRQSGGYIKTLLSSRLVGPRVRRLQKAEEYDQCAALASFAAVSRSWNCWSSSGSLPS